MRIGFVMYCHNPICSYHHIHTNEILCFILSLGQLSNQLNPSPLLVSLSLHLLMVPADFLTYPMIFDMLEICLKIVMYLCSKLMATLREVPVTEFLQLKVCT